MLTLIRDHYYLSHTTTLVTGIPTHLCFAGRSLINQGLTRQTSCRHIPHGCTSNALPGTQVEHPAVCSLISPPVYYRDTFGLQPVVNERNFTDSIASECSDDSSSMATKSTVKTTMNIFHQ
uniref:Uncharacterized protein n=1 Tax=Ditylenchus dipsaci TaxID=166011 RepID=A0A915DFS5_9BILA